MHSVALDFWFFTYRMIGFVKSILVLSFKILILVKAHQYKVLPHLINMHKQKKSLLNIIQQVKWLIN